MAIIANYPTKKHMKENEIGKPFNGWNPSIFGDATVPTDGTFPVCNRPSLTGHKREFFAIVTTQGGLITEVT